MRVRQAVPAAAGVVLGLAALALAFVGPGVEPAVADIYTFDLTTPNSGVSCCTGPYVQVQIDLTSSTTAEATFTSLTNGGYIYLLGDGGTADLNVNGTYSLGTVTESNSIAGFTSSFKDNTPGTVDGFGNFTLSLNNNDGFADTATQIMFGLTATNGTMWSSASQVLVDNTRGQFAAAHVYACAEPGCSTSSGAFATGFVATPEPASLPLFGTGLMGLVGVRAIRLARRRRNLK